MCIYIQIQASVSNHSTSLVRYDVKKKNNIYEYIELTLFAKKLLFLQKLLKVEGRVQYTFRCFADTAIKKRTVIMTQYQNIQLCSLSKKKINIYVYTDGDARAE